MRILISGGTGRLGQALAQQLKAHTLVLWGKEGADITDAASIDAALAKAGDIDVLINAAGTWVGGDVAENDPQEVTDLVGLNLTGSMLVARAVLPQMKQRGRGLIINLSSDSALIPDKGSPVYAATKSGIAAFSESLRHQVAADGIRVSTVYPGSFDTEPKGNVLAASEVARAIAFIVETDPETVIPHLQVAHRDWKV